MMKHNNERQIVLGNDQKDKKRLFSANFLQRKYDMGKCNK